MKGDGLKANTLKNLLAASYEPRDNVDEFILDRGLSSTTSQVFVNPHTGQAVVAHKGTNGILDHFNNFAYALGGTQLYKKTKRFKDAENVQRNAENKYGAHNVTTIGHSQAGLQAELLGKNGKEIITLNKATRPFSNKKHENQFDIQTTGDVVSKLNPFQKRSERDISIQSPLKLNPLGEHAVGTLGRLDPEQNIGRGIMFVKRRIVLVT